MRESQFQILEHRLGAMALNSVGESLAIGYSPDLTATQEGKLRLILENEPRSDLKAVIGCYQRAEKYCRDVNATPSLVIVTSGKGRIGVRVAAERLEEYARFWKSVNPPGALREVLLLTDREYSETVRRRIALLSPGFRELCVAIALTPTPAPDPEARDQESPASRRTRVEELSLAV